MKFMKHFSQLQRWAVKNTVGVAKTSKKSAVEEDGRFIPLSTMFFFHILLIKISSMNSIVSICFNGLFS